MWQFLVAFVLCVDEKGDLIVAPLKMPLLLGKRRLRFNLWRLRQPWLELRWPQTLCAPCPRGVALATDPPCSLPTASWLAFTCSSQVTPGFLQQSRRVRP